MTRVYRPVSPGPFGPATIFASRAVSDGVSRDDLRAVLAGLESASGGMRGEIARRLSLRHAPKFSFFYDESPEKRHRIDALLDEIAHEPKGKGDE